MHTNLMTVIIYLEKVQEGDLKRWSKGSLIYF